MTDNRIAFSILTLGAPSAPQCPRVGTPDSSLFQCRPSQQRQHAAANTTTRPFYGFSVRHRSAHYRVSANNSHRTGEPSESSATAPGS